MFGISAAHSAPPPVLEWAPSAPPSTTNTPAIDSFRENQPRSCFTRLASTQSAPVALFGASAMPLTSVLATPPFPFSREKLKKGYVSPFCIGRPIAEVSSNPLTSTRASPALPFPREGLRKDSSPSIRASGPVPSQPAETALGIAVCYRGPGVSAFSQIEDSVCRRPVGRDPARLPSQSGTEMPPAGKEESEGEFKRGIRAPRSDLRAPFGAWLLSVGSCYENAVSAGSLSSTTLYPKCSIRVMAL